MAKENEYELLTHSRMACAKSCLRKHWFEYELGIEKIEPGEARAIGTVVHDGLHYNAAPVKPDYPEYCHDEEAIDRFDVMFAKASGMVRAYLEHWGEDGIELLEIDGQPASEIAFTMPIFNPHTSGQSRTFRGAGKIDALVKVPAGVLEDFPKGCTAIMEHKTCSDSLDDNSDYWKRIEMDQQISMYWLGAEALKIKVDTILYNVIRKPDIRPKQVWACDECNVFVGYTKKDAKDSPCEQDHTGIHQRRETADEYEDRVVETMLDDPDRYFCRRAIPRLRDEVDQFRAELWQQSRMLGDCRRLGFWFRNTSVCIHPFRCDFLDVCNDDVVEAPLGFKYKIDKHSELTGKGVQ